VNRLLLLPLVLVALPACVGQIAGAAEDEVADGAISSADGAPSVDSSPSDASTSGDAFTPDALVPPDAAEARFRVVGYFPSWAGEVDAIRYDRLTHINYAFILPTASGGLTGLGSSDRLDTLVGLAHANGLAVLISVGGWNDGDDSAFETLAADAGLRATFVDNLAGFVEDHDLDGADIDWEYPDEGSSSDNYTLLMQALADRMHSEGKLLTAAVVCGGYLGGSIAEDVFAVVDFLNLMAYDGGTPHSPYSYAVSCLDYWSSRGLSAEKTVLGVPFYGRDPYVSYRDLVAQDPTAPEKDQVGDVYYNGIATIKQKTELAMSEATGIMMWELSQDTTDDTSLLGAIDEVVNPP